MGRVVPLAIEAAVDQLLNAAADGIEESGDRQRRQRDRQVGALRNWIKQVLEEEYSTRVDPNQDGGQAAVDERTVDDPVNVPEPVAQDREAGGDRDRKDAEGEHDGPGRTDQVPGPEDRSREGDDSHHSAGKDKPLELLPFLPIRSTKAEDQ